MIFKGPEIASAHRRPPSIHEILHRPARLLHRTISLLSMFPAVAGVQPETSRSIKPRERDLGDLHLFFLVRILTRPTNHPRHAACASNHQSKPVRPRFWESRILLHPVEKTTFTPAPAALLTARLRAFLPLDFPTPAQDRKQPSPPDRADSRP